jgi:multidrug efflux pump subunit AcrA (membrane-fusion protein)
VSGRVAYIDPLLNEQTRTGRVRIEIANPGERLKVGMFVEVRFKTSVSPRAEERAKAVLIPEKAVQRLGERVIVFVPIEGKAGRFAVRDVQLGEPIDGHHPAISGVHAGEHVVTNGSFILKTQLMKGELGEE